MEVDMTHTEETSNKHHTTSTYVEPPREEKKEGQETPGRETPKTKNIIAAFLTFNFICCRLYLYRVQQQ